MTAQSKTRSRNWCFTVNNYTANQIEVIQGLTCRYIIYGKEVGEQGTPHLQGYVSFAAGKTLSATRTCFPAGVHLTASLGSAEQNITYCSKENDTWSKGTPPVSNTRKGELGAAVYDAAWEAAKLGNLEAIPAQLRIRYYDTFRRIAADYAPIPAHLPDKKIGIWLYAPSDAGKTTWVMTNYPDIYRKDPKTKWFDGYIAGQALLLDDVSPYSVGSSDWFKEWTDKWRFRAEFKGGSRLIRPPLVIITSQYTPYHVWPADKDLETRSAILNRFNLKTLQDYVIVDYLHVYD